jgi:hypothetical protein
MIRNLWKKRCCLPMAECISRLSNFFLEDKDIFKGKGMLQSSLDLGK